MTANGKGRICFGDFEFDPDLGHLFRDGQLVRIQPQPLRVLRFLIERAGHTVSREELRNHIWGGATYVEFDQGLNYCIRQIRIALGDNAVSPAFVETFPRQGYRFLAQIAHANDGIATAVEPGRDIPLPPSSSSPAQDSSSAQDSSPAPERWFAGKRVWWAIAGVAGIALAATMTLMRFARQPEIGSLAVLPLENLSGDPGQDYLADGMTDELITMLVKSSTLRIVSRTSVMQYKRVRRPLPEIAQALGVDGVIEGSITRTDGGVHMTVQLINARSDAHVWADSFDQYGTAYESLSREVARAVAARLNRAKSEPAPSGRSVRPEAHDAYLHGRYLWFTNHNDKAGEYFRKAADLQPDYALAWTGIADYYAAGAVDGEMAPRDSLDRAAAAARKAVALDESLAQAHLSLCAVIFFAKWNGPSALQECARALELDPELAEAWHLRAKILGALNRHDEAVQAERNAMEINPFARPWGLLFVLSNARRYDAAIVEGRARLESNATDFTLLYCLSQAYRRKGMFPEAVRTSEVAFRAQGNGEAAAQTSRLFHDDGYRAVVRHWLAGRQKASESRYVSPVSLASMTAQLGEREQTLALLERAYEEHSPALLEVQFDPAFDFVHADERYRAIIRKMGLPPAY